MMTTGLDLLTVGRISVDLFSEQINTSFSQPQTFQKSIGGSPTNVAVAAAKLGHKSAVVIPRKRHLSSSLHKIRF
jgi:5-dehydro-2-deoxygluconokinase